MSIPRETQTVNVDLGARSYEICIAHDRLDDLASTIADWQIQNGRTILIPGKALIVTDVHLDLMYATQCEKSLKAANWQVSRFVMEPGEKSKSLAVASAMYDRLVEMEADRQTVVIAVGGGVVGDAAGFAAATYARGIPFIQIPTSLLAQVDSSVGGKVGINHPKAKNLIGAFHQPWGVFIDIQTLASLADRDYRSGLAEVVKYGVILDAAFFEFLEENVAKINERDSVVLQQIVVRSCQLKARVVEQDEEERTGLRAVLNYGHTFAHAFEALVGYGQLMHGEAVAIGMVYASRLAEKRGLIPVEITECQVELLEAIHLPIVLPNEIALSIDDVMDRMKLDKKVTAGKLRFVLPTRLGHVEMFDNVPEADVRSVLNELM